MKTKTMLLKEIKKKAMSSRIKNLDGLINDAIWLCKEYERVAPPLFQRFLGLDYDTAEIIFRELEKTGLVVDVEEQFDEDGLDEGESIPIGNINKEKLAELLKN